MALPEAVSRILTLFLLIYNIRLLGLRDGTKLGFWRNLVGQGEKWVLLKAATVATGGRYYQQTAANSGKGATRVSYEEANSKGTVVHLGDMILLQTFKTDNLLTLQIGAGGPSQLNSQNYSSGGKTMVIISNEV